MELSKAQKKRLAKKKAEEAAALANGSSAENGGGAAEAAAPEGDDGESDSDGEGEAGAADPAKKKKKKRCEPAAGLPHARWAGWQRGWQRSARQSADPASPPDCMRAAAKKKKSGAGQAQEGLAGPVPTEQTDPPTVPIKQLFTSHIYPEGEMQEYKDECVPLQKLLLSQPLSFKLFKLDLSSHLHAPRTHQQHTL